MLGLGVIGLGVQGRRMLQRLAEHDRVCAVVAWDPDPAALTQVDPLLAIADGPEDLIRTRGLDCVFIASPPVSHLALANLAFDAGLPVFCEKPLSTDFAEARRTLERIERERRRGAVNFSLASSAGLAAVKEALDQGELGALQSIEIEVAFQRWPRPWQSAAGRWLAERREGGFTREVLSHFVFVLQRVLRKAVVVESTATYPADGVSAETALMARLRAGDVPVTIKGSVGGDVPDFNRFALACEHGTLEFQDWMASRRRPGVAKPELPAAQSRPGYLRQLDELAAFIEGKPNKLPDFAEALAVQETIEAMLSCTPAR